MAKKVIQVPVDVELLKDLDSLSKQQGKSRPELIRQACLSYLERVKDEELDKLYQQGYIKIPEEPAVGKIQIAMAAETLSKESW